MAKPKVETDITEILKDLQKGQKDIQITLETIKGDIKALDAKVEQLDKRIISNQEFLNRGVFIGLLVALLGGVVNFFGWIPKS